MTITALRLRGILDSRAQPTIEAEVTLRDGACGRGSCPRAIAPGRRERPIGPGAGLGPLTGLADRVLASLAGVHGQHELDERLAAEHGPAGVSLTLAVSVAYARAAAAAGGIPLWRYLAGIAGTMPRLPRLLVNVFSGGIHAAGRARGYQQVMIVPKAGEISAAVDVACRVWAAAAAITERRFGRVPLSASSGLLVPLDSAGQLDLLGQAIGEAGLAGCVVPGIDVAAEHLREGDRYRLADALVTAADLASVLRGEAGRHGVGYIEDPFDPGDEHAWRALRASLPGNVQLIGDDLFASDASRVSAELADGILLKPSQAGTISGLVAAATRAREAGMTIAVSHRSGETDDTVICDIACALGAEVIKVGGPRRGDRLAKYNQLLRLAEEVPSPSLALR
jgi:enolase